MFDVHSHSLKKKKMKGKWQNYSKEGYKIKWVVYAVTFITNKVIYQQSQREKKSFILGMRGKQFQRAELSDNYKQNFQCYKAILPPVLTLNLCVDFLITFCEVKIIKFLHPLNRKSG